ncbi:hypothetical protein AXF42_Ash016316 [Apostasia shenzhenica]|uniref:DUF3475 domain-containing protein n=1 Tax=Apostasia shenzhenica TaxID=1088818 RepID=A0A2H9ZXE4_9ASPA|nr:hypothetical protein AXF42_Ash016316 [Apostasia shenzhenica]
MGGFCSKRSVVDHSLSEKTVNSNGLGGQDDNPNQSHLKKHSESIAVPAGELEDKWLPHPSLSFSDQLISSFVKNGNEAMKEREPSKPPVSAKTGGTKVSDVSSILGKASTVGFGKAVDVLDTLGSSMSSLNVGSGFVLASATKGIKILILAFEVANTIVKGANLMHSLLEENVKRLKEVILPSEGVQLLVSKDMDELLRIAAVDKREELKVFSVEVIRFGNRCKDPQWHNLDRYFEKLFSDLTPQPQLQNEAEANMQQLMSLVQHTAELYHELHALDKMDQDYRRRLQEEENLIMEKLLNVLHFLHLEINDAFGTADGDKPIIGSMNSHQRLGSAGLALHYANIITQIDTMLTVAQMKSDMDKTLLWLVPIANNTTKAHQGFGWVGEWANMRSELNQNPAGQTSLSKIETLHYANKEKTEAYMINLIVLLHQLICLSKLANGDHRSPAKSPIRSPTTNQLAISLPDIIPNSQTLITQEDQKMLQDVNFRRLIPGISKSQEFDNAHSKLDCQYRLSKSSSHSPTTASKKYFLPEIRPFMVSIVDFNIDRIKALDVMDRVDSLQTL